MKKIFSLLFIIGFSIVSTAQKMQCISGPTNIYVGQTVTFTSISTAQCTSCYDWDINGSATSSDNSTVGNVKIVGSDTGKIVSIQILSAGCFTLKVTYFDETGCHDCELTFCAVQAGQMPHINCFGFDPTPNYTTDPVTNGVLQYAYIGMPGSTPIAAPGITFTWTILYSDGSTINLNGQNPTFWDYCNPSPNAPYLSNPVEGFMLSVTNGITTANYYSNFGYGYPETQTCFIHEQCPYSLLKKDKIIVSPNPTNSIIQFDGENLNDYKVTIFDINGIEVVKDKKINSEINIEKQNRGIYMYIITDGNGYKQEGKIIKE